MRTERDRSYNVWRASIKRDRGGKWKCIGSRVLSEDGDDPIQVEIRKRLNENEQLREALGRGLLALLRRRKLNQQKVELIAEYWKRAEELSWSGFQRG
jgi:hypothetical protein